MQLKADERNESKNAKMSIVGMQVCVRIKMFAGSFTLIEKPNNIVLLIFRCETNKTNKNPKTTNKYFILVSQEFT